MDAGDADEVTLDRLRRRHPGVFVDENAPTGADNASRDVSLSSTADTALFKELTADREWLLPTKSMNWSLLLLQLVPLIGLLTISIVALVGFGRTSHASLQLQDNLMLVEPVIPVLSSLQLERGLTGACLGRGLGGQGEALDVKLLRGRRVVTDLVLGNLRDMTLVDELRERFPDRPFLGHIDAFMLELPALRARVDALNVSGNEALDCYTVMDTSLIDLVTTVELGNGVSATPGFVGVRTLLGLQEIWGKQRSYGTFAYSVGAFTSQEAYAHFAGLIGEELWILGTLHDVMTTEQRALWLSVFPFSPVGDTNGWVRMRNVLLTNDPAAIVAEGVNRSQTWFELTTIEIDKLSQLGGPFMDAVREETKASVSSNTGLFLVTSILVFVSICSVTLAIVWLRRLLVRRTHMETAVSRFVPTAFLKLLGMPKLSRISLGDHVERDLAILFLDVRNFTLISETMTNEECYMWLLQVTHFLSPIIHKHHGFIDKFMGDGIMAVFESAHDASCAAVQMVQVVRLLNDSPTWVHVATCGVGFDVGIGIHYGPVVVGTVDDSQRFDGTIISDTVNVAARLEGLTKQLGVHIVVSGSVAEQVKEGFQRLGRAVVSGRSGAIEIFELFGGDHPEVCRFKELHCSRFEEINALFQGGEFRAAEQLCQCLLHEYKDDVVGKEGNETVPGAHDYGGGAVYAFRLQRCAARGQDGSKEPVVDEFVVK